MSITEDTQALLNIAEQLPEAERLLLYRKGYEEAQTNCRGAFLENYTGDNPLAASDLYFQGYTDGKAALMVAKRQHEEAED